MEITDEQRTLLTLCAIRVDGKSIDWSLLARMAAQDRGLDLLCRGELAETSNTARSSLPTLRTGLEDLSTPAARVDDELAAADLTGAKLVTVLDEEYPANLRLIPNRPPFLFYRGTLCADDARSLAVVGTRTATSEGLQKARNVAQGLVRNGITVTSGLARGVDTAAHREALDSGGRTIAVIGTGITHCYPSENHALAEEITERGAVVSQFWPTRGPRRDAFPRRNVVTSGISQGTIVIEASSTSGAKMQARIASEHGKKVFLVPTLVEQETWAQRMIERGKATVAESMADVLPRLNSTSRIHRAASEHQLAFGLL